MRIALLALVAGLLTTSASASAQARAGAATSSDERRLLQLEDQWTTALVKRDAAFFRRNLHPDYVYSDERGVFNKEQVIAEQVGGTDTVTYATNENMHAHVHGTAAAVTGILVVRGHGKDGPFEHRYRYTDSFVRGPAGWQMYASQDFEMPKASR
jgi:ketosteroid isomerase-like protein